MIVDALMKNVDKLTYSNEFIVNKLIDWIYCEWVLYFVKLVVELTYKYEMI
jgi:hypothetical protein